MNPFVGPRRYPAKPVAHGPVPENGGIAPALLRRHLRPVPLRRGACPIEPAPGLLKLTPEMVDVAQEALAQGEVIELQTQGQQLVVRVLSSAQDVVTKSGLHQEQMVRLYERLAESLGTPEEVTSLPRWKDHPDCRLYRATLAGMQRAHVFTFLILPRIDQGMVTVLACEHDTQRAP